LSPSICASSSTKTTVFLTDVVNVLTLFYSFCCRVWCSRTLRFSTRISIGRTRAFTCSTRMSGGIALTISSCRGSYFLFNFNTALSALSEVKLAQLAVNIGRTRAFTCSTRMSAGSAFTISNCHASYFLFNYHTAPSALSEVKLAQHARNWLWCRIPSSFCCRVWYSRTLRFTRFSCTAEVAFTEVVTILLFGHIFLTSFAFQRVCFTTNIGPI